jgi:phage/plasmid-associated DNA primase
MIVLRSTAEGVGKSTVGYVMAQIFGKHSLIASSTAAVFGEFNEVLTDKSLVVLEEAAFPGDHKLAAASKNTITAKDLSINPKGRPRYSIPNRLHLMLCTNEQWAVPAGADARRFFVLDVRFDPPSGYFDQLYAEIDNGGAEAMLHDLLKVNLGGFHPRNMPITEALVHQQRLSADQITRWVYDCVAAGQVFQYRENGGFGQEATSGHLYAEFSMWARNQSMRPMSHVEFGRSLRDLGMTSSKSRCGRFWTVPDARMLFVAAERRARIRKATA